MPLCAGDILDGRYRLLEPLGLGGQSSVWRAEDVLGHKGRWAVKVVDVSSIDLAVVERARREAHVLHRIQHPSLVRCHHIFEDLDRDLLVMVLDLVPGRSLARLEGEEALQPSQVKHALKHVAAALECLHSNDVVHRDLKPANVLLTERFFEAPEDPCTVKLVDLGLATLAGNPTPVTQAGRVVGTLRYMAPEQLEPRYWQADPAAARVDIFAFGLVAHEALLGAHPISAEHTVNATSLALEYRSRGDRSILAADAINDARWRAVLEGCLRTSPAERFADGSVLTAALRGEALPAASAPDSGSGAGAAGPAPRGDHAPPAAAPNPADAVGAQASPRSDEAPAQPASRRRLWVLVAAALAIAAALLALRAARSVAPARGASADPPRSPLGGGPPATSPPARE